MEKYIHGFTAELINDKHIDIAIEVSPKIFEILGVKNQHITDDNYIENDFGVFYLTDNNIVWFWAITNKTINSRVIDRIGKFYLTDGETSQKIPMRTKQLREFKKIITPKLNKELKKYFKSLK